MEAIIHYDNIHTYVPESGGAGMYGGATIL